MQRQLSYLEYSRCYSTQAMFCTHAGAGNHEPLLTPESLYIIIKKNLISTNAKEHLRIMLVLKLHILSKTIKGETASLDKRLVSHNPFNALFRLNLIDSKRVRGGVIHETDKDMLPEFVELVESPDDVYRYSMKRVDDLLGRYRYR